MTTFADLAIGDYFVVPPGRASAPNGIFMIHRKIQRPSGAGANAVIVHAFGSDGPNAVSGDVVRDDTAVIRLRMPDTRSYQGGISFGELEVGDFFVAIRTNADPRDRAFVNRKSDNGDGFNAVVVGGSPGECDLFDDSARVVRLQAWQHEPRDPTAHSSWGDLRAQLKGGKYTKWAADLTVAQLVGVLWLLGEFNYRMSSRDLTARGIDQRVAGSERRAAAALHALADYSKTPLTAEEVRYYIRSAIHVDRTQLFRELSRLREQLASGDLRGRDAERALEQMQTVIDRLAEHEPKDDLS